MRYKFLLVFVFMAGVFSSCGNNSNQTDAELKDPAVVHPPSEAIPDSTKLVNDSVIVPDVTPGNGSQVGSSDSIQRGQ